MNSWYSKPKGHQLHGATSEIEAFAVSGLLTRDIEPPLPPGHEAMRSEHRTRIIPRHGQASHYRDSFYAALPPHLAYAGPNIARVTYLIHEFIRVLGLTSVVIERGEYFTGVAGAGMQRDHLANLMTEHAGIPDPGGALHLSRLLPPEPMSLLLGLPHPKPERAALVEAQLEMAR